MVYKEDPSMVRPRKAAPAEVLPREAFDHEIDILRHIVESMGYLDSSTQKRVVNYLLDRYGD